MYKYKKDPDRHLEETYWYRKGHIAPYRNILVPKMYKNVNHCSDSFCTFISESKWKKKRAKKAEIGPIERENASVNYIIHFYDMFSCNHI